MYACVACNYLNNFWWSDCSINLFLTFVRRAKKSIVIIEETGIFRNQFFHVLRNQKNIMVSFLKHIDFSCNVKFLLAFIAQFVQNLIF